MEIQITSQQLIPGLRTKKIKQKLKKALEDLGCHDRELSVLLTDDHRVAQLNDKYLGRKRATNVLAFPMAGGPSPHIESAMLGDVVISVDTALRESKDIGEPVEHTIDRLLIHGILHLLGYDHEQSTEEAARMEKEQNRLIALFREE
jgi:probable rRNA maturation factor